MKHRYIFNHDHYYHTLRDQIGEGVPVFHGVRQRGGGLGSVLGGIAKYAIPLIQRYILPHAKKAALSTLSDIATGQHTVKQVLQKNGAGFLKNVGKSIINPSSAVQTGSGINHHRQIRRKAKTQPLKKKKAVKKPSKKIKTIQIRKKKKSKLSGLDIFS